MISSKKYVDQTLKKYSLDANKALGQNFLVSSKVVENICNYANINESSYIIEIGPGLGAVSEEILNRKATLLAIEIDHNMVNILKNTFKNDRFSLIHQDFLKINLEELFNNIKNQKDIKIISNLPYYITSQILNKLILADYPFNCFVAMMQKEVGKKILSPERKDLNPLQCILKLQYDVSLIQHVSKNDYLPRPEIDSIVLKFQKKPPLFDIKNLEIFVDFLKKAFQNRRKTLMKNLSSYFNKNQIEEIYTNLELSKEVRIDEISLEQIVLIYKTLHLD